MKKKRKRPQGPITLLSVGPKGKTYATGCLNMEHALEVASIIWTETEQTPYQIRYETKDGEVVLEESELWPAML